MVCRQTYDALRLALQSKAEAPPEAGGARARIAFVSDTCYARIMKTLTVKLPDRLAAEIEAESRERRISKSDVVRERLQQSKPAGDRSAHLRDIADLIGSVVDDLPADLSVRTEEYLRETGFGRDRGC